MNLPKKYSQLTSSGRRDTRESYIKLQNGLCFYCKSELINDPPVKILNKTINWRLFPANFLKYPVHLQHNHETDYTEGAVHSYCNAVMWQYEGR